MGFKCGIVGLPNVGKSTLFNALTQTAAAQAANYPFCTIEPNVGDVAVPDPRLEILCKIAGSEEIIPTRITFVDIAGLVRGASKGEGLGNQFLATIREVDAVAHVLRCFQDDDITHVEGRIDPLGDAEVCGNRTDAGRFGKAWKSASNRWKRRLTPARREAKEQLALMMKAIVLLREGKPARTAELSADERGPYSQLGLMTAKPVLYVCNVEEGAAAPTGNDYSKAVEAKAKAEGARAVTISCTIEEEIAQMPNEERGDFLESLGLNEPGLNRLIRTGYDLLGLLTFFTVGPKETHAWTVTKGSKGPKAAGAIHSDFEQGYIRAEPSPMTTMSPARAKPARARRANSGWKARTMSSPDGDVMHSDFAQLILVFTAKSTTMLFKRQSISLHFNGLLCLNSIFVNRIGQSLASQHNWRVCDFEMQVRLAGIA